MPDEFNNILFKDKQVKILVALADKNQRWYLTNLARSANATYVHTSKFIARCQELGIVDAEVHGKIKTLKLTEKGQNIADSLMSIASQLSMDIDAQKITKQDPPAKQDK